MVATRRPSLRNDDEQPRGSRNHDDQPATCSPESVRPVHAASMPHLARICT